MINDPIQTAQKDRLGDFDNEFDTEALLDADRLPKIPRGFAVGSIVIPNGLNRVVDITTHLMPDVKDAGLELAEMFTGIELTNHPKPETYQTPEEQIETQKKAENAIFHQRANQNLEQAQANVVSVEQQEIMMAALRNDVDTSQQARDRYGKRELNKHDIFAMATQQGKQREQVQEQIEVAESKSIQPNDGYNLNQVAEGGKLSAVTSAG